jgi:hypothetical protein
MTKFRGRCWRSRRYREQKFLECAVKAREYSFRGRNLEDVAGDILSYGIVNCKIRSSPGLLESSRKRQSSL